MQFEIQTSAVKVGNCAPGGSLGLEVGTHVRPQKREEMGVFFTWSWLLELLFDGIKFG
jgi:hypothetical protein